MPVSLCLRRWLALTAATIVWMALSATSSMAAGLTVTPLTWDIIGLKDTDDGLASGPHLFPVGVKVCNSSGGSLTGVQTALSLGTGNTAIALASGAAASDVLGSLAQGACASSYYTVDVELDGAHRGTNREYTIDASADGGSTGSTGTRKLYVQGLASSSLNITRKIAGPGGCNADLTSCDAPPTDLAVGKTYTYKLYARTSSGRPQLESFLTFPGNVFQVKDIQASYAATNKNPPISISAGGPYADACGWVMNGDLGNSGSCAGPVIDPWDQNDGLTGRAVVLTYTVKVVGAGSGTLTGLVYDFLAGAFHYNSDYGDTALDAEVSAAAKYALGVAVTGQGTVDSSPGGINCGAFLVDCAHDYLENSPVTLTASEDGSHQFNSGASNCPGSSWSLGAGSGASETYTCALTMSADRSATAVFAGSTYYPLTAVVSGGGQVTSPDSNIGCSNAGGACGYGYISGASVTLTASPAAGSTFASGSSSCPGSSWVAAGGGAYTCAVTLSQAREVTASFDQALLPTYLLDAAVTAGSGAISSSPVGMNCNQSGGPVCSQEYEENQVVTLTSTPAPGQRFSSGVCPGGTWTAGVGSTYTCTLTMTESLPASVAFQAIQYPLVVSISSGQGTVTSSPAGISCSPSGTGCSATYDVDTSVQLTATPGAGQNFDSGMCPGSSWTSAGGGAYTCTISMAGARSASVVFATPLFELSVVVEGKGTVSGDGLNCSTMNTVGCTHSYDLNTTVTLAATPTDGYLFDSGVCPGGSWSISGNTASCSVLMSEARQASAKFVEKPTTKLRLTLKSSRSSIKKGQKVKLTGSVKNTGAATATGVRICLVLPKRLARSNYSSGGKAKQRQVCWSLASLAAGRSSTVWVKARVGRGRALTVSATAAADNAKKATGKVRLRARR